MSFPTRMECRNYLMQHEIRIRSQSIERHNSFGLAIAFMKGDKRLGN